MPSLKDCRSVLVIGATAGLGRSLAKAFRALPSKPTVIAAGRRRERLEQLEKEDNIVPVQLDVSTPRQTLISDVNKILEKYPDVRFHSYRLLVGN
jgi:NADP-dependent 3-hydroxy acid dehydrogenase YdfG